MDLPLGALLGGRYIVEDVLGRGGFATVYAARHAQLHSKHAVKVLRAGADEDMRGRMLAEGRIQARLSHRNVVRVTDVVELVDGVALVMDRVEGETLRAVLDRGAPALPVARRLADGILEGVAAAHAEGLIHRDLKPDNVLIGTDGTAKVTDFGLARAEDPALRGVNTEAGIGMGTPGYMAPEAYTDVSSVDARADVFALGAILYELLSGQRFSPGAHPWFFHYQRASSGDFARLETLVPDLPAHLVHAVHAALAPDPDARPASVSALTEIWRGEASPSVRDGDTARGDASLASAPQPVVPRHHLPAERDRFVGRSAELAALDQRFASGARLVTVLGIGGAGKTRFVTHYGWIHLTDWPGGVWFCDLSEARDAEGILYAVGSALNVPLGRDPIQQLGHAVAERGRCVVILDNFEQVAGHAAETLGRWLDRADQAVFLVTTRERLGLAGEQILVLDPLAEDAAVDLFVERARAAKADFSGDDRPTLLALVGLLDHLPLAIELAAARVRLMTPSAILGRMGERFKMLSGPRGRVSRHSTLRAMLDWSWDLLGSEEQAGLAQLSVFAGGFTLEAAEAVLDVGEAWPTDIIQSLVDRSLVRRLSGERLSGDRLDLLASVAEYAAEQLDSLGLRPAAEARHGAWYARSEAEDEPSRKGSQPPSTSTVSLSLDLDNLNLAARRALGRGDVELAASAALRAWSVIATRGPLSVGIALLRDSAAAPGLSQYTRARLHQVTGSALQHAGQRAEARAELEAALVLWRALGKDRAEARTLGLLGILHGQQGRTDDARALVEAAFTIAQRLGDRSGQGALQGQLAELDFRQGRVDAARARAEAALADHQRMGDLRSEVSRLNLLGLIATRQGRLDEADVYFARVLAFVRETGDQSVEAVTLHNLALVNVDRGSIAEASALYHEALAIFRRIESRPREGMVLGDLGLMYLSLGQYPDARQHLERALAIHLAVGNAQGEGVARRGLGLLELQLGLPQDARVHLDAALAIARDVGDTHNEGVVLADLGRVHQILCARVL